MASGYSDLSEIRKSNSGNTYGLYQKPAKINLLNERPRRESIVEQQLSSTLTRANTNYYYTNPSVTPIASQYQQQQQEQPPQPQQQVYSTARSQGYGPTTSQLQQQQAPNNAQWSDQVSPRVSNTTTTTTTTRVSTGSYGANNTPAQAGGNSTLSSATNYYAELESELAQKEARLKREIAHLNQKLSPWARPRVIREPRREPVPRCARDEQRWVKECPSAHSSRPNSRASSTRSNTGADLMDKASKLLRDAEELEKKPLKTQSILIEDGAKRRESPENQMSGGVSSVHTAVITVPYYEPDNKSPLPVAFDNFSTLGVRGNLASLGAAPPDTPYAPIFPMVKRTTPSPMNTLERKR